MNRLFALLAAIVTCVSVATVANARMMPIPLDDPLNGQVAEIVTIFGAAPTSEPAPRLRFAPDALAYSHICFPAATGRDGTRLGGPLAPDFFGPRPAIECVGLPQDAVNIAFALSRASHIEITGPNTVAIVRGEDTVMTLRLLN